MLEVPKVMPRMGYLAIGLILFFSTPTLALVSQYEQGQIIVKFVPEVGKVDVQQRDGLAYVGIASVDQKMAQYGVYRVGQIFPHKRSELGMIYQIDFDPQHDALDVAQDFATDEHLQYAEPRYIHQLFEEPNDPFFLNGEQWYLNTVHGPQAWDITHGDSAVVIGIVDSGVDWDHPDLWDNIWLNPGEDVDGNGRFSWVDLNGLDDDGNGYVDDFFGWDFSGTGYPDNNPMDAQGHGTHCAGIASAVTDNEVGVAGMSWNCTIMPVKAGEDGSIYINRGFQGILYAADNGADVISLSWGNTQSSSYEKEIIDSANAQGAIIVAGAGNDPPTSPPGICPVHYPAGYDHVVAVAATNQGDRAAGFTFYGSWVDVSAPGVNIYSTLLDNAYYWLSGTSMSCPLVAGVAALLKSVRPDMTSDEFGAKMWYTSDDIYSVNPEYVGLLGGGRVNAYAALLSMAKPRLVLDQETTVNDAEGNQDGRPDPDETVNWIISLSNTPTWQLAQDVGVKISTPDETIALVQDSVGFGDIEAGESADNSGSPFRFFVSDTAGAHWATFYFQVEAGAGAYTMADSLEMMIGRPEVLLVDDDGGDDVEERYKEDLEKLSVIYDTWVVAERGKISAEELLLYRVVIWLTGAESESTLTAEDRGHLATFLEAENNLFLTGQNIGDEVGDAAFFGDYLHVVHVADTVSVFPPRLEGIEGDTLSDGTLLFIWGEGGPQESPSGVQAISPAMDIYIYQEDLEGRAAATRYESPQGYKVVYFAFGYEGIREGSGLTSPQVVLERIMNWFGVETETGVDQGQVAAAKLPCSYALFQNYPNPFNTETAITYRLPRGAGRHQTTLRIYNVLGQRVRTLVNEVQGPGIYNVFWDGRDGRGEAVSTAIYFYRLEAGEMAMTKKMVLLR